MKKRRLPPPLIPTFIPPTARQKKQRAYYQALGTVKGFHGYLNNLQRTLKHTELPFFNFPEITALHHVLRIYEDHIRGQLQAMKHEAIT